MAKSKKSKKAKKRNGKKPLRFNTNYWSYERFLNIMLGDEPDQIDAQIDMENHEITFELTPDSLMRAILGNGRPQIPLSDYVKEPINETTMREAAGIYETALEKLGIAMPMEEAMSRNIIDIRDMSQAIKNNAELYEKHFNFIFADNAFFNALPCFTKGTLLEPDESVAVWDILDINIAKQQYTVKIQNYLHTDAYSSKKEWLLSDFVTTTVRVETDTDGHPKFVFHTKMEDICERPTVYQAINLAALDMTQEQKHAFQKGLVQMSFWHLTNMVMRSNITGYMFSQISFIYVIAAINMFLEQHAARKPSQKREAVIPTDIKNTAAPKTVKTENRPPERTLRVVDMITFSSDTVPRRPTEKTVIKYITPAWQVRGHVRHYKSGKTAYIPPHVNRRKKFTEQTDTACPQQIIRIRDNTDTFTDPES